MTEIEKLQRAQMYISKLANGINPLNDNPVDQNEIINNERISRCLRYVSEVLDGVIKSNRKTDNKKKVKKLPFFLSPEARSEFVSSEIPMTASEIARYLNSLADLNVCYKLRVTDIIKWLVEAGLLETQIHSENKEIKYPTSIGLDLGIFTESRSGLYGNYTAVFYNQKAQMFIVDNIEAIVELRSQKISAENQGAAWTDEQDKVLKIMFSEKKTVAEIAEALKRSTGGIRARLKRLGLIENRKEAI